MAKVRLLCGPATSERAETIDACLAKAWGRSMLIVPTSQYAAQRTNTLYENHALPGAWGSPVVTFQDFVGLLLGGSPGPGAGARRIANFEQRLLVEQTIQRLYEKDMLSGMGEAPATAGFVTHIQRVIAQLKQAALEPGQFRDQLGRRRSPVDEIVARVYETYQDALLEKDAYDLQGMYWVAADTCERECPALLETTTLLLLDGFDDYTPSEFRLIKKASRHVDELVFGLNYDMDPGRRDLYAITRRTAEKIQEEFPVSAERLGSTTPGAYTEFIAQNLFWRDRPSKPEGLRPNLTLMPCHGPAHEIETVVRTIKRLVLEKDVALETIAVVSRDLEDRRGLFEDVFNEFGVPVHIASKPPILRSAVASFLVDLIAVLDTWERDKVVDVLRSPWFTPAGEAPSPLDDTIPALARQASVISGYGQWEKGLDRLKRQVESGRIPERSSLLRAPLAAEAIEHCASRIARLKAVDEALPKTGAMKAHIEALDALIERFQLAEVAGSFTDEAVTEIETLALEGLRKALYTLWRWYGTDGEALSRADFLSRLRASFAATPIRVATRAGGVQCMDMESVRRLRFDYVFFVGANEGVIPRALRPSAIYPQEEVERLEKTGIVLETAHTYAMRERLLFHHIFDVPRQGLYISWHGLSADGTETRPSPFIQDVTELFPGLTLEDSPGPGAGLTPNPGNIASWRDCCNVLNEHSLPEDAAIQEAFHPVMAGLQVESERQSKAHLGEHDGVFSDGELVAHFGQLYGSTHHFSAQQIETYGNCPFRFYIERLLRLDPCEPPEALLDALSRGAMMHTILERFHRRHKGIPIDAIPEGEAAEAMDSLVRQVFSEEAWRAPNAPVGLMAVEGERMADTLQRYLRIATEEAAKGSWRPEHFEVSFGSKRGTGEEPLSKADPFALNCGAETVLIEGRIDRIDRNDDAVRIIDYKSSDSITQKDIDKGRAVQLTLYAFAVEAHLLTDSPCDEAVFLAVGKKKAVEGLGKSKDGKWELRKDIAVERTLHAVNGMRAGRFHPTLEDKTCAYCPAGRICRHERARLARKAANHA